MKEMILKHYDERNVLLRILLDGSLSELKEIAVKLSRESQLKRLVCLQNKQRWLLFDDPGNIIII